MTRLPISLIVVTLSLMTVPLRAQSGLGIVAGITRSHLASEGSASGDPVLTGVALGVSYTRPLGGSVQFAPELLFVQKGFGIRYGTSTFGPTVSFLEMPLLLRASIGSAKVQPFAVAGVAPALKLSCTYNSGDGTTTGSTKCGTGPEVDTKFKPFDVSAVFGAGLAYARFSMSVRYDLGLVNTITDNNVSITSKNRSLMLLGGVSF